MCVCGLGVHRHITHTYIYSRVSTFQSQPQQASSDLRDLSHAHLGRPVRIHCLQPHVLGKASVLPRLETHTHMHTHIQRRKGVEQNKAEQSKLKLVLDYNSNCFNSCISLEGFFNQLYYLLHFVRKKK